MKIISILLSLLFSTNTVWAFECELMQLAAQEKDSFTEAFEVEATTDQMKEYRKEKGEYRISYQASQKWLSLTWYKNSELLAMAHAIVNTLQTSPTAIMLYNPKNPYERLSMMCSPSKKQDLSVPANSP